MSCLLYTSGRVSPSKREKIVEAFTKKEDVYKRQKEDIKKLFLLLANISKKDNSFFRELSLSQFKEIREQQPQVLSPRKEIDSKIFDVLGLTEDERKEVYWATAELVKNLSLIHI